MSTLTPNAVLDSMFDGPAPSADEWRRIAIGLATQAYKPATMETCIASLRAALAVVRSGELQPLPHLDS